MTRQETIAVINAHLATASEETVRSVAAQLESALAGESSLPRALTPRELALIEQSKADFAEGRTFSPDELQAYLDAAAAERARVRNK